MRTGETCGYAIRDASRRPSAADMACGRCLFAMSVEEVLLPSLAAARPKRSVA
jgi:hypothetical protein